MQKVKSAGVPKKTVTGTSSNTAQSLEDLGATVLVSQAGSITPQAIFADISVETNAVRVCRGGDATTSLGDLLQPGDSVQLQGNEEVSTATFISAVAGAHASLQITTEF
jgi:hypothetical protein